MTFRLASNIDTCKNLLGWSKTLRQSGGIKPESSTSTSRAPPTERDQHLTNVAEFSSALRTLSGRSMPAEDSVKTRRLRRVWVRSLERREHELSQGVCNGRTNPLFFKIPQVRSSQLATEHSDVHVTPSADPNLKSKTLAEEDAWRAHPRSPGALLQARGQRTQLTIRAAAHLQDDGPREISDRVKTRIEGPYSPPGGKHSTLERVVHWAYVLPVRAAQPRAAIGCQRAGVSPFVVRSRDGGSGQRPG
ncbi:hypothetical protein C8J57DRAFT_1211440 [Mycena rebaudengoi]|nr:hypothetical protein C8J57DRAFT_1211440 [Mycena rebaudengoi]